MESKNNLPVSQSDTAITRTPAHVAADINKIKMKTAVVLAMSAVEMGRLLCEAKSLVPHGEWGAWLEANVDFSESKAQTLMRCYKEYGDGQIDMISSTSDLDFFAMLTVSQMDALLALPKPKRREFVEEHREELEERCLVTTLQARTAPTRATAQRISLCSSAAKPVLLLTLVARKV